MNGRTLRHHDSETWEIEDATIEIDGEEQFFNVDLEAEIQVRWMVNRKYQKEVSGHFELTHPPRESLFMEDNGVPKCVSLTASNDETEIELDDVLVTCPPDSTRITFVALDGKKTEIPETYDELVISLVPDEPITEAAQQPLIEFIQDEWDHEGNLETYLFEDEQTFHLEDDST